MSLKLLSPNPRFFDRDQGQPGILAPSAIGFGRQNVTLVANQAYVMRFVPSRPMAITLISFEVTTFAGSDDAVDVGIYDSTLTTKIASSGATTGKLNASNGLKTIALSANLAAGQVYYAALACGAIGTTAAILAGASFVNFSRFFGTAIPNLDAALKAASHPLPSSLAGATGVTGTPMLGIRES